MKAIVHNTIEYTPEEISHNLEVITRMMDELFMQRTDYDQEQGDPSGVITEGEYALKALKEAFPNNLERFP